MPVRHVPLVRVLLVRVRIAELRVPAQRHIAKLRGRRRRQIAKVLGGKVGQRVVQVAGLRVVLVPALGHRVHQARYEVGRERNDERTGRGADATEDGHDVEPDADVLDATRHRAPVVLEELLRVQAHLEDVVEQREQRRQREGHHEDGDEAELDDWCARRE